MASIPAVLNCFEDRFPSVRFLYRPRCCNQRERFLVRGNELWRTATDRLYTGRRAMLTTDRRQRTFPWKKSDARHAGYDPVDRTIREEWISMGKEINRFAYVLFISIILRQVAVISINYPLAAPTARSRLWQPTRSSPALEHPRWFFSTPLRTICPPLVRVLHNLWPIDPNVINQHDEYWIHRRLMVYEIIGVEQ